MFYLDTSLLVTAMTPEPASAVVQHWLYELEAGETAISEWVSTEFAAALSVKLRSGKISTAQRDRSLLEFVKLSASVFEILPIGTNHFRLAADFAHRSASGLRAGDALHLAVASSQFATLCTRDRRLAEAAGEFGVATRLV